MNESTPFSRAIRDFHRDDSTGSLVARDGPKTETHPIEAYYFEPPDVETLAWLDSRLDGPLLDLGAGAGRHALHFQERFETVAVEPDTMSVETMIDRGVENAVQADMFALRESFGRDRFRSALVWGTQLGLARSMEGVRRFLNDLAAVTTPDATAVVDSYDPAREATTELLGYRLGRRDGLAFRVLTFEYDGELGRPLLFVLFAPDRLCEAAKATGWTVAEVRYDGSDAPHYAAVLEKRSEP